MSQTVIVGGGIIGLSTAFELARREHKVVVLESGEFGQQASWAGAGMLPPANAKTAVHPLEHLTALSNELHQQWSIELKHRTGIDNGYRKCGSLHLARTPGEIASLMGLMDEWTTQEIAFEQLKDRLPNRFPFLHEDWDEAKTIQVFTPEAAQFDNRKQIDSLLVACRQLNVALHDNVSLEDWSIAESKLTSVAVKPESVGLIEADQFLLAAGPWTEHLASQLGVVLPMQPVRGQLVGYRVDPQTQPGLVNAPIINEGSRYLVTREDGQVIGGSTIEEIGFDDSTSESEITELKQWVSSIVPAIERAEFHGGWAGLRPATYDGFPYLGKLPGLDNVLVATGHFKSGLQWSTGTAVVLADLLTEVTPPIDLSPFAPSRVNV
ncbi:MAG: FAD-binding oxidoreductase [Planctomycetota bacterium]